MNDGFTPMPADPVMIKDVMGWHAKTGMREQTIGAAIDFNREYLI